MSTPSTPARSCGFTLIESMIGLAVSATLTMSAAPYLASLADRQAVTETANELQMSLELGRSEAMVGGTRIVLAPRGTDWASGWLLYRDDNDNGAADPTEPVLRVFNPGSQRISARAWGAPASDVLSFREEGFLRRPGGRGLAMGGISFSAGEHVRTICFSATRTRITTQRNCS